MQIAQVDEEAEALAGDEDRVAAVKRVGEEKHAAADREEPEGDGDDALARTLGRQPLHEETSAEQDLRDEAYDNPPVHVMHDVEQVAAYGARQINEHSLLPPRQLARVSGD